MPYLFMDRLFRAIRLMEDYVPYMHKARVRFSHCPLWLIPKWSRGYAVNVD